MPEHAEHDLIVSALPLVSRIARRLAPRAGSLSVDDLVAAGSYALVLAARDFDSSRGASFLTYARHRITGAVLDELRNADWASRTVRTRAKTIEAVRDELRTATRHEPTADEVALRMGIDARTVTQTLGGVMQAPVSLSALDEVAVRQHSRGPEDEAVERERREVLNFAIDALPPRARHIVRAIYFDERTAADVARELGVTPSAVTQQRAEALRLIRDAMQRYFATAQETPPAHAASGRKKTAYFARIAGINGRLRRAFAVAV